MSGKLIDLAAYRATRQKPTNTIHCEHCYQRVPATEVREDAYGHWWCDSCVAESDRRWARTEDAADDER